jgi:TRAP-type C4-dicarboxylate transport system permease small subunit
MAEQKAFRIMVLETIAALMTAAFGLIAALAWNDAIGTAIKNTFTSDPGIGQFVYAVIVTIIAVIATIAIARVLARMKTAVGGDKPKQ